MKKQVEETGRAHQTAGRVLARLHARDIERVVGDSNTRCEVTPAPPGQFDDDEIVTTALVDQQ